jgi:hypothetical protein
LNGVCSHAEGARARRHSAAHTEQRARTRSAAADCAKGLGAAGGTTPAGQPSKPHTHTRTRTHSHTHTHTHARARAHARTHTRRVPGSWPRWARQ